MERFSHPVAAPDHEPWKAPGEAGTARTGPPAGMLAAPYLECFWNTDGMLLECRNAWKPCGKQARICLPFPSVEKLHHGIAVERGLVDAEAGVFQLAVLSIIL